MIHITVSLPDNVAEQYFTASKKIGALLEIDSPPKAQTLMRFLLASFTADEIAEHFDRALRNITGMPMPNEGEIWVFTPEFEEPPINVP